MSAALDTLPPLDAMPVLHGLASFKFGSSSDSTSEKNSFFGVSSWSRRLTGSRLLACRRLQPGDLRQRGAGDQSLSQRNGAAAEIKM
jgi:hypothetical protein